MATIQIISVPGIESTGDPARIAAAMTAGDDHTKQRLASNANLTAGDIAALARENDESTRGLIAERDDVPDDLLARLAQDSSGIVRAKALANAKTDAETFAAAVHGQQLPANAVWYLARSVHAVAERKLFEAIWRMSKPSRYWLLTNFNDSLRDGRPDTDPGIAAFIDQEILGENNDLRRAYAMSESSSNPAVLDKMKDDRHRPVINAVAGNPRAWLSTHEHLAASHKTPAIRIAVAGATTSNDLLNSIYAGTKSEQIRKAVEANPAFVRTESEKPARRRAAIVPHAGGGGLVIDDDGKCFESLEALEAAVNTGNDVAIDFDGMECDIFTEDEAQAVRGLVEKHGLTGKLKVTTDEDLGYYTLLGVSPGSRTHCYLNIDDETHAVFDADTPGPFILELLRYLVSVGHPDDDSTDLLHSVYRNGHIIWGIEDEGYIPFTWDDVEALLNS
ncbi:hypothetical protein [Arthrobacter sp. zg-Y1110]|uniref:hypothetical protein n=1 Tax=Arthrobacter sp. zg-Y1110 TaxID=2886932 RepID=UPI001D13B841|nr:hypothetical protein [Arthrobacter sp. zg-Y1110]MCC3292896.1 hypothetical protein [Arthrobacter sp. zg-Y1110]UWX86835.1 hypothetical protein N2K99_18505 [Arthrobacter sp. zg-Y1110]